MSGPQLRIGQHQVGHSPLAQDSSFLPTPSFQEEPQADSYYGPHFLLDLKDMSEARSSSSLRWEVSWLNHSALMSFQEEESNQIPAPFRVYVLDEDFNIVSLSTTNDLEAEKENLKKSLGTQELSYLENPINYSYKQGSLQNYGRVLVYRASSLQGAQPTLVSSEDPREALQQTFEKSYLDSRYGKFSQEEGVEGDFSAKAIRNAWQRVHPQMNGEGPHQFAPVVESPLLAQMMGALQVYIVDESVHNDLADIAMGQGVSAANLLAQLPELSQEAFVYVTASGGGGLLAGASTYIHAINPQARMVGVNSDRVPVLVRSLEKGSLDLRPKEIDAPEGSTSADGIDVPDLSKITFEQILNNNVEAQLVTEDEIYETLVFADAQNIYRGEGSAVLPIAAAINGAVKNLGHQKVVLTRSGRNIDEGVTKQAYKLKPWVKTNPALHLFICKIRTEIRRRFNNDGIGLEHIRIFNRLLQDPAFFKSLESNLPAFDDQVQAIANQVEEARKAMIFIPEETFDGVLLQTLVTLEHNAAAKRLDSALALRRLLPSHTVSSVLISRAEAAEIKNLYQKLIPHFQGNEKALFEGAQQYFEQLLSTSTQQINLDASLALAQQGLSEITEDTQWQEINSPRHYVVVSKSNGATVLRMAAADKPHHLMVLAGEQVRAAGVLTMISREPYGSRETALVKCGKNWIQLDGKSEDYPTTVAGLAFAKTSFENIQKATPSTLEAVLFPSGTPYVHFHGSLRVDGSAILMDLNFPVASPVFFESFVLRLNRHDMQSVLRGYRQIILLNQNHQPAFVISRENSNGHFVIKALEEKVDTTAPQASPHVSFEMTQRRLTGPTEADLKSFAETFRLRIQSIENERTADLVLGGMGALLSRAGVRISQLRELTELEVLRLLYADPKIFEEVKEALGLRPSQTITDLAASIRLDSNAAEVATNLSSLHLSLQDFEGYLRQDGNKRHVVYVHTQGDVEVLVKCWPPGFDAPLEDMEGHASDIHDHAGVVGVEMVLGSSPYLVEQTFENSGGRLSAGEVSVWQANQPTLLADGKIHRVRNPHDRWVYSVHLYWPRNKPHHDYTVSRENLISIAAATEAKHVLIILRQALALSAKLQEEGLLSSEQFNKIRTYCSQNAITPDQAHEVLPWVRHLISVITLPEDLELLRTFANYLNLVAPPPRSLSQANPSFDRDELRQTVKTLLDSFPKLPDWRRRWHNPNDCVPQLTELYNLTHPAWELNALLLRKITVLLERVVDKLGENFPTEVGVLLEQKKAIDLLLEHPSATLAPLEVLPEGSGSMADVRSLVGQEHLDSPELLNRIAKLYPGTLPYWDIITVHAEGSTLREHTLLVLRQFEKYVAPHWDASLPVGVDFMRLLIALHDLSKAQALAEGRAPNTGEDERLLEKILQDAGYTSQQIKLGIAILESKLSKYVAGVRAVHRLELALHNRLFPTAAENQEWLRTIPSYFQKNFSLSSSDWQVVQEEAREGHSSYFTGKLRVEALESLKASALATDTSPTVFYRLKMAYYMSDSSAYTTEADNRHQLGNVSAFDDLYVFENNALNFQGPVARDMVLLSGQIPFMELTMANEKRTGTYGGASDLDGVAAYGRHLAPPLVAKSSSRDHLEEELKNLDELLGPPHYYGIEDRNDLTARLAKGLITRQQWEEVKERREKVWNELVSQDFEAEVKERGRQLIEYDQGIPLTPSRVRDRIQDQLTLTLSENPEALGRVMRFTDVLARVEDDGDEVLKLFKEYFDRASHEFPLLLKLGIDLGTQGAVDPAALKFFVKQMARKFIAGEDGREAASRFQDLAKKGAGVIADILGEATTNEEEAEIYLGKYLTLIEDMASNKALINAVRSKKGRPASPLATFDEVHQVDFQISLKLSSLYSQWNPLDPEGTAVAVKQRLRKILDQIKKAEAQYQVKIGLTLDLEQYEYRDLTYRIFKELMMEPDYLKMENVGVVVQAYLKDSETVLEDLAHWSHSRRAAGGASSIFIRLVKGAYWDFENILASQKGYPLPVFPEKEMTDAHYEHLVDRLLNFHEDLRAGIASHNARSLSYAITQARHRNIPLEIQMLYGMDDASLEALLGQGITVNMYSPVGKLLDAMAYLARRLLENASQNSFLQQKKKKDVDVARLMKKPMEGKSWEVHRDPVVDRSLPTSLNLPFENEPLVDFSRDSAREQVQNAYAEWEHEIASHRYREPFGKAEYPVAIGLEHEERRREIFTSINPSNPRQILGTFEVGDEADAQKAAQVAAQSLPAWQNTDVRTRAQLLLNAASIMRQEKARLIALVMLEAGKTLKEADGEVAEAIDFLELYAREAVYLEEDPQHIYNPNGVAAVISPWNFPLAILTGLSAAPLVTGNTVVIKPAEQTPLIGYVLYDIYRRAGIPAGVVNYLPGDGGTGKALVAQKEVQSVAFTGSKEVGLSIYEVAAPRGVKVVAEMGGKNGLIVDSNADPDDVIKIILQAKFGFGGQKCSALDRLIIVGTPEQYESMVGRLVEAMKSLHVGDVRDFKNAFGPVIDQDSYTRLINLINATLRRGDGNLLVDGRGARGSREGYFIGPTLFEVDEAHYQTPIFQEENFGPILAVTRASGIELALNLVQDSEFGLTGAAITRSPENRQKIIDTWKSVGVLYIDRPQTGAIVERQPFGGLGLSGIASSKAGTGDYLTQFVHVERVEQKREDYRTVYERVKRKTQERMEAKPQQPQLLGEQNYVRYQEAGPGWILFGENTSLAQAASLLSAAVYSGNDVKVLYSASHTQDVQFLFALTSADAAASKSHIVYEPLDLSFLNRKIEFGETPKEQETRVQSVLKEVHWIAFGDKRDVNTELVRMAVKTPPGQRFVRTIIDVQDVLSNDFTIFQAMTRSQTVSINRARHGFSEPTPQPLDRKFLSQAQVSPEEFVSRLENDPQLRDLFQYPEQQTGLSRRQYTLKLMEYFEKYFAQRMRSQFGDFNYRGDLGLIRMALVFHHLTQPLAQSLKTPQREYEMTCRLMGRLLLRAGYNSQQIQFAFDLIDPLFDEFGKALEKNPSQATYQRYRERIIDGVETSAASAALPAITFFGFRALTYAALYSPFGNGFQLEEGSSTILFSKRTSPYFKALMDAFEERKNHYLRLSHGERLSPQVVRHADLGNHYEIKNESGKNRYHRLSLGLYTWEELISYIQEALNQAKAGTAVEIEVKQYQMPSLTPPREFLNRLTQLARSHFSKKLFFTIQGDPMDPPQVYWIIDAGELENSLTHLPPTSVVDFWDLGEVNGLLDEALAKNPQAKALFQAMKKVQAKTPASSLNAFLFALLQEYNAQIDDPRLMIPLNKRTRILRKIEELRALIKETILSGEPSLRRQGVKLAAGALIFDPVSRMLRTHEANAEATNHAFSIGGGAMAAQLRLAVELMDRGALPLDFRLTAVDMSPDLIWEVNEKGTNRLAFEDKPLNGSSPEDPAKRIYYINASQRNEYLRTHPAHYIFLNLKAEYLTDTVLNEDFLQILQDIKPVVATPAKAYDKEGKIPYLEIYQRLAAMGFSELADRFIVEGGYFSAPDILAGKKIFMTLAGGSMEALKEFARIMTPLDIDDGGRADWDAMEIKFIASVELAAFLMAGGANKNFLTYRLSRNFMGEVLNLDDRQAENAGTQQELQNKLDGTERVKGAKEQNIEISEEIIARLMPAYGYSLETDHHSTPQGLRKDIETCAPPNLVELYRIRTRVNTILQRSDYATIEKELRYLVAQIEMGRSAGGLGDGTRNARDGYIDEVLKYVYEKLKPRDLLQNLTLTQFQDSLSPYRNKNAQEGRNGIRPLMAYVRAQGIVLPREFYETWNLYFPDEAVEIPQELERKTSPNGTSLIRPWGLPRVWVDQLGREVIAQRSLIAHETRRRILESDRQVSQDFYYKGLQRLSACFATLTRDMGTHPEVTRRLMAIHKRLENLLYLLRPEVDLSQKMLLEVEKEFKSMLGECEELFTTPLSGVGDLLNRLRVTLQKLFRVELALEPEEKKRLGTAEISAVNVMGGFHALGLSLYQGDEGLLVNDGAQRLYHLEIGEREYSLKLLHADPKNPWESFLAFRDMVKNLQANSIPDDFKNISIRVNAILDKQDEVGALIAGRSVFLSYVLFVDGAGNFHYFTEMLDERGAVILGTQEEFSLDFLFHSHGSDEEETKEETIARIQNYLKGKYTGEELEKRMQLLTLMADHPLGLHLLQNHGLSGPSTDLIYGNASEDPIHRLSSTDLEEFDFNDFIYHGMPGFRSMQERLRLSQQLTLDLVRGDPQIRTVASLPSGRLRDLLTIDWNQLPTSPKLVAIDYDPETLAHAKEYAAQLGLEDRTEFWWEDALSIQRPEQVDLLLSHGLNIYLNDEQTNTFYKKAFSTLSWGGYFMVTQVLPRSEWQLPPELVANQQMAERVGELIAPQWRARSLAQSIEQLQQAGFVVNQSDIHFDSYHMNPVIVARKPLTPPPSPPRGRNPKIDPSMSQVISPPGEIGPTSSGESGRVHPVQPSGVPQHLREVYERLSQSALLLRRYGNWETSGALLTRLDQMAQKVVSTRNIKVLEEIYALSKDAPSPSDFIFVQILAHVLMPHVEAAQLFDLSRGPTGVVAPVISTPPPALRTGVLR